ncbi:MAG TPA: hypothetical protein VEU30_16690 [Thermoanaerobaculia bacterium]|nr:hypothetical protein [Thermoanaerobaculia bacterium]
MATIRSWGLLTGPENVPLLGTVHLGHHTWVTAEPPTSSRSCWPILGGGDEAYCKTHFYKAGVYEPPGGANGEVAVQFSAAEGSASQAECMGGVADSFFGLPTYAGVVYGLQGVCHQMANRVLLTSGSVVWGARGFTESATMWGIYGTRIPTALSAALIAVFPPSFLIIGAYVVSINGDFGIRCFNCGVRYPGPILAAAGDQPDTSALVSAVLRLHDVSEEAPPAAALAELATLEEAERAAHETHMQELELLFQFGSRGSVDDRKIRHVLQSYDEYLQPDRDVIGTLSEARASMLEAEEVPPATPEQLTTFAHTVNASALRQRDEVANILGVDDFQTLFASHPDERIGVINRRILRGENALG